MQLRASALAASLIRSGLNLTKTPQRSCPSLVERIDEAVAAIRRHWRRDAQAAVILGTGMGRLSDHIQIEAAIPYRQIPFFPCSTAIGHKGRFVCGMIGDTPAVTMDGRCHLYEGYPPEEVTLPIHVMRRLGARMLAVSNASGGMNPRFTTGDIMVIEDHINLLWHSMAVDGHPCQFGRPQRTSPSVYDRRLMELALAIARRENFVAHRGVYVAVPGPNYETRAEYRAFRRMGGDVVGMSTVPEALVAAQLGMRVLAVSIVTNVAKPDAPHVTSAEEVVLAAEAAEPNVRKILMEAVSRAGSWRDALD